MVEGGEWQDIKGHSLEEQRLVSLRPLKTV